MVGRKIVVKNEVNEDGSEYSLVCEVDGVEYKREVEYSLGDMLYKLYWFESDIYEELKIDCRFDSLIVEIKVEM